MPISSPDLPNPGIEPGSPALQADSLTPEPPGKPWVTSTTCLTQAPGPSGPLGGARRVGRGKGGRGIHPLVSSLQGHLEVSPHRSQLLPVTVSLYPCFQGLEGATDFLLLVCSCSVTPIFATPWTIQPSRLLCPSLSPGVCSKSCPLSR